MSNYKIITGCAKDCEEELNSLSSEFWITVLGFSADKDLATIIVELSEK